MSLQTDLLEWYDINKRPLVFREHKDPYAIWVSEIMAQQTRIEAMLPYTDAVTHYVRTASAIWLYRH